MRYELTDREWTAIKPMLPNKPRGIPRVNDRRVLNGPDVIEYSRTHARIQFDALAAQTKALTKLAH